MQAEIIAIGDELVSGQRVDTNSAWLSQRLGELGIRVAFHSTAGDDLDACSSLLRNAMERVELVLCTGGLGPTADDLTRQAIAAAVGRELVLDEAALAHIKSLFNRRGHEMPDRNRVQAMFPEGSAVIPNPHGTAPGIDFTRGFSDGRTNRVLALPGVPAEMKEMWDETVRAALKSLVGPGRIIGHHCVKCFGIGESDLEQRLPDLIRRGREPAVGITVHRATITLRVTADGTSEDDCRMAMQPTIDTIHECLGHLVFGEEEDELQDAVARRMVANGQSLTTGEIGTRGLVARWLGATAEAASFYRGGLVVRDLPRLASVLGTEPPSDEDGVERYRTMAESLRTTFGSDYSLLVGAFPVGGSDEENFHVTLSGPHGVEMNCLRYAGHPDILEERAAKQALDLLRLKLLNV